MPSRLPRWRVGPIRLLFLLAPGGDGSRQLAALGAARIELELVVRHLGDDLVLARELAAKQLLRQRVLQVVLDGPAQRTRPVLGVGAVLDQEILRLVAQD